MSSGTAPPIPAPVRRLLRLVDELAAGNRRPARLAARLAVQPRQAALMLADAAWLGLVHLEPVPHLTRAGLDVALKARGRRRALAEALPGGLEAEHPRQARLLRALDAERSRAPLAAPAQLELAFEAVLSPRRAPLDRRVPLADSPDVYAVVLRALLDAGELSPARIRAVLDDAGAGDAPVGACLATAVRRGDAWRVGDDLVATPGAVARGGVADSVVTVGLSDPEFRAWLARVLAGERVEGRFAAWLLRLAGPGDPRAAVDRVLFGRSLASVPLAGPTGEPHPEAGRPFLEAVATGRIVMSTPTCLADAVGGVAWANAALRAGAADPGAVRLPSLLDLRRQVHGGVFHPGERPVRAIPDALSFRIRCVRNVPALALLVAAGWLARRRALRLRRSGAELVVDPAGVPFGALVERCATEGGWTWVRGGASWERAGDVAVSLGLLARSADVLTLDEGLFVKLGDDAEHRALRTQMQGLVERVAAAAGR
jgi:hypothetical protein